uniref:Putative NADH dehydrogenase n=1 Tax=viral metagenome TaxID=1070528 RepID=A0A6M3XMT4_9ZZZZ
MKETRHEVRVIDNKDAHLDAGRLVHDRYEYVKGDIRYPKDMEGALDGVDGVVHLAAVVGEDKYDEDQSVGFETNIIGTRIVAEEAKRRRVRKLVFASTGNVYGKIKEVATEDSPVCPVCRYGASKLWGENDVVGAGYVVVRFGTVCGASPTMRWDLLPHQMAKAVVNRESIEIYDPLAWRPFTEIKDATRALIALVELEPNPSVSGKVFNVVSENVQKATLMHYMKELGGVVVAVNKEDKRSYRMDGGLVDRTIGWRGKGKVKEAMEEVAKGVRDGSVR